MVDNHRSKEPGPSGWRKIANAVGELGIRWVWRRDHRRGGSVANAAGIRHSGARLGATGRAGELHTFPGMKMSLRPTGRAGVTLIELLIVITMIGILTGIMASKLDWKRYEVESMGRGVLADIALAQRTAVSLQNDVRVTVLSPTRIQFHEDGDNDGGIDAGERVTYRVLEPGYAFGQGSTPGVPAPADGTELTAVVFRRDGTANRNGTFYIAFGATGSACKYCRAVAVQRSTGRVTLYSLATGSWKRLN